MSFTNFNLQKDFINSIDNAGYKSPTNLQSQLIPLVAERKSALVLSQSAAGKTGAFLIPAINYILENPAPEKRGARILVLTSRRDRVSQINYTIKRLSSEHNMRFGFIVSGRPYQTQMRLMRRPLDIMIATPGRLNDLMDNNKADFSQLEMLIIDDFSSIYQKNLQGLVENIIKQAGKDCPSLVFVANDDEATSYAKQLFKEASLIAVESEEENEEENTSQVNNMEPIEISVSMKSATLKSKPTTPSSEVTATSKPPQPRKKPTQQFTVENIPETMPKKVFIADDYTHKIALMDHFMDEFAGEPTVIYTSTEKAAKSLQENLTNHGHTSELISELSSEDLSNNQFETLILHDQSKAEQVNKLSLPSETHIIHFDLPHKTDFFFKRLTIEGSDQAKSAIVIVDGRNFSELKQIEKTVGNKLEQTTVPGLEPLVPFINRKSPRPEAKNSQNRKNNPNPAKPKNKRRPQNKGNKPSPKQTTTQNSPEDNQNKRQRKGPFGRLNGGAQRKQTSNRNDNNNNGGNNGTNNASNKRRQPSNRGKQIGVSTIGTQAPANNRGKQSDYVEQAPVKRVVIRYKDKKRSFISEKLDENT